MSPRFRNAVIYVLVALCGLILASRVVTVTLVLMHAPDDAETGFFLMQTLISAICIGAMIWIWGKRVRP